MSKRFIITIISLLVIVIAAGVAIFLAKGYTISTEEKRIVGTGIVTVTSEPDAASVFIDGHLTTATNATVSSLPPKKYTIRIVKEGFIPWEKQVEVKEGLVTAVKSTLFPSLPTIYPLTYTGVTNPILSPDGSKLAFIVPSDKKRGVWVWTMVKNQPIAFARSAEPHQIAESNPIDFSQAILRWSSDSKYVLATVGNQNWLLNSDQLNSDPRDITPILDASLKGWEEDAESKEAVRVLAIKNLDIREVASSSAQVLWAPDETKFMASANADKGEFKVYDIEEEKEYQLPPANLHLWLPDSEHIILLEENKISVLDFDGTNKAEIYAEEFEDNFVFPWPDSSRLVIIRTFSTPTGSEPNLYGINLR